MRREVKGGDKRGREKGGGKGRVVKVLREEEKGSGQ